MTVLGAAALAGCGGAQQDAHEPNANFTVSVVRASFPTTQSLAEHSQLQITVRNSGSSTVPNIAVTVNGLNYRDAQPGLQDPNRPVWIIDQEPVGGVTADTNTWALGSLAPGATTTFDWHLTAEQAGEHLVSYRVAAGLNGLAKAVDASGAPASGAFSVDIGSAPPQAHVNPATGVVEPGPAPLR
ncbi:MAG TPA: hypothetical protein VHX88_20755 [Solirubrobacteraceae bacterium]|nr:hypothetical protein [Solirubrobacteraceae bacterium]